MLRLSRFFNKRTTSTTIQHPRTRVLLVLSNLMMVLGVGMLLYVGGMYALAEYGRYAARGDNSLPAPQAVAPSLNVPSISLRSLPFLPQEAEALEPAPFTPPQPAEADAAVTNQSGQLTTILPDTVPTERRNTITRIVIPRIDVDSKVVPVGWEFQEIGGQQVAIWQVAEYAVGHHVGSANPGESDNIVLAGHVGGYGKVFRDLIKLEVGDRLTIYSAGEAYQYIIRETLLVTEEGVSAEQQAENARYIAPTDSEVVTLVTCWPLTGPKKFSERIIVQAVPVAQDPSRG
jgi:sortase A